AVYRLAALFASMRAALNLSRTSTVPICLGATLTLPGIIGIVLTIGIAVDSNVLIGTGPVRGFAVTLGVGIITTVFTAFTLTRLIVAWWVRYTRPPRLAIS